MRLSNLIVAAPIGVFCALAPAFYRFWMPSLDPTELTVLSVLTVSNFIPWAGPQVAYNVFTVMNRLRVNSATFMAGAVLNVVLVLLALNFTDLGVYAIAGVSAGISIVRNLVFMAPYVSRLLGKPWWTVHREMAVSLLSVGASAAISLTLALFIPTDNWASLITAIALSCLVSWAVVFISTFSPEQRSSYVRLAKSKILRK